MDEDEVSDEELPVLRLLRSRVSVDFSSSVQEAQNQPRRDRRSSILGGEIPQPSTSSGPSSLDVSAPESRPSRNSGTSRKPSIDFAVPRVEISSSLNDAQRPSTSRGKSRSSFHRPDLRRRSTVSNGFPSMWFSIPNNAERFCFLNFLIYNRIPSSTRELFI